MKRVILVGTHAIMTFGIAYGAAGTVICEDNKSFYPITVKLDRYKNPIRVARHEIKTEMS